MWAELSKGVDPSGKSDPNQDNDDGEQEEDEDEPVSDKLREHNKTKPHPLLRPRSLAGISADLITRTEPAAGEVPKARTKPQFGMLPIELAEHFPEEPVPAILIACLDLLEADIRKEGLFRIPGRMTSILDMKNSFEQGNGLGVEVPETLEVAGLVAQFFRELPEPLLTYEMYYNWLDAVSK